jgi:hypothetical protein
MDAGHYAIKKRRATRTVTGRARTYKASKSEAKPFAAVIEHFRKYILTGAQITAGDDGPYTWILKQKPAGNNDLVAARTRTEQELGTLHSNLDYHSGAGTIVAAGEFLKGGKQALYNLQSGTFMARKFPKRATSKNHRATQAELQGLAEAAFTAVGLTPTFNKAPEGAPAEQRYAGLPIIDTMEILATVAEMEELDRLMSASSEK